MSGVPLDPDATLIDAVAAIEANHRRIAVVVGDDGRLAGTLTDGDIRRWLLSGGTLDAPVHKAMKAQPITASVGSSTGYLLDIMRRGNVLAIPLVDADGKYNHTVHLSDLVPSDAAASPGEFDFAVVMAGGEGRRLRPITEQVPKPMVDIGGVPLLERQVRRLAKAGIRRVYIAVNYLGHLIESHFQDGAAFAIEVRYLRESEKMGTGGALGLLPELPRRPILVMNGDILTTSDFGSLSAFHAASGADVTVAAFDYRIHIPFGVIQHDGAWATGLVEKPSERFLCNAGIYVLSPKALEELPGRGAFDMTELIEARVRRQQPVAVFPVHEYWSDIGTTDDLERARSLFWGQS